MFSRPRSPVLALPTGPSWFCDDAFGPRDEDLWDAWAFAASDARRALRGWHVAAVDDRCAAYVAYQAALDREEQAAHVLELHSGPHRRA